MHVPEGATDLFGAPSDLREARDAAPAALVRKDSYRSSARPRGPLDQLTSLQDLLPHGLVPRASSFALVMIWTLCGVVYAYTAIAKTEPDWISGEALRNITRNGETITSGVTFLRQIGFVGDAVWPVLGLGTIAVQVVSSAGYLTASVRDRASGSLHIALAVLALVALVAVVSFHIGAEIMGLEIGWFSFYMIALAIITFLPASLLGWLTAIATWIPRALVDPRGSSYLGAPNVQLSAILAMVAGLSIAVAGYRVDLPGAFGACVGVGAIVMAAGILALMGRIEPGSLVAASLALMLGGAAMHGSLSYLGGSHEDEVHHDVRFDYWRFAGGDFRRRGEWERALEAYMHANLYAPRREDRRDDRVRELQERIASEGPQRAR